VTVEADAARRGQRRGAALDDLMAAQPSAYGPWRRRAGHRRRGHRAAHAGTICRGPSSWRIAALVDLQTAGHRIPRCPPG
jgi:hypothetical protein